jgi:hypothetical protein
LPNNGKKAVSMDERLSGLKKAAQQASLANKRLTAKSLWDKLRMEVAKVRERLETRDEELDLALELHAPSGSAIRISNISYYPDTNDALLVVGRDVLSGEECQAIVPVQAFYVIFRISESRDPERKPIGFNIVRAEGSE